MDCRRVLLGARTILWAGVAIVALTSCGDDDSFSPVAKDRGYEYAYASANDLSKTPCNEMRKGRNAVIGRDKDLYTCIFDRVDSVYLWAGEYDTLTAGGREFIREESSSSEDDENSSSSMSSSGYSSSYSSSRNYSSSYSSSNSVKSSSSSWTSGSVIHTALDSIESKDKFFNPDIDYGIMTDPRDGKKYRTVEINGMTWMAENLNFADSSEYPLLKKYSLCYNHDAKNCELLGRLYERAAAMNDTSCTYNGLCNLGAGPVQGICPDGWHIPSYEEASKLVVFIGTNHAEKAMSVNGWGNDTTGLIHGADTYGLSFVGTGSWTNESGFKSRGLYTTAWIYNSSSNIMHYLLVRGEDRELKVYQYSSVDLFYPVRCVKGQGAILSSSSMSSSNSVSSSSSSSSSISSSSVSSSSLSSSSEKSSSSISSSSESSSSEMSSSSFDKSVLFNANVSYGEMTDPRDGKTYRTVNVAGKTWMAENLNFADSSKLPLLEGNSRCYDDDPNECVVYGRLYSREVALNDSRCTCYNGSCPSTSGNVQGVCPSGWHIPSTIEAEQLVNKVGNQNAGKLNSSYGWNAGIRGTNEIGTSFTGTGVYRRQTGYEKFDGKGKYTNLWIFDGTLPNELWYLMDIGSSASGSGTVAVMDDAEYDPFFPVRCVKD